MIKKNALKKMPKKAKKFNNLLTVIWLTEEGILVIGVKEFLLNENSLDL